MIIWILAFTLLALLGLIGFFQGAIRTTIVLIGIMVALAAANPLAPTVEPWMASLGVSNPLLAHYLAPALAFVLVDIVFQIIAEIVHWRVAKYYRYKTDEVDRLKWVRMNRKVGLSIGALTGTLYAFLICVVVYPLGYLTIQIPTGQDSSKVVEYVNSARKAMPGTGLEKLVAHFDPTPEKYYEVVDVLGLLYHNPDLHKRILGYPDFLNIQENPNVQAFLNDEEIQRLTQGQGSVMDIINNPTFLTPTQDQGFLSLIKQVEPNDLAAFLRTGISPKYKDERILGRWQIDPFAVVKETIEEYPAIKSSELVQAKKLINTFRDEVTFTATPDNNVVVKLEAKDFAANFSRAFGVNLDTFPRDPVSIQKMFNGQFQIQAPEDTSGNNNNNNGFNPAQGQPQGSGQIGRLRGQIAQRDQMAERYGIANSAPQYQQPGSAPAPGPINNPDDFNQNGDLDAGAGAASNIPDEVVIARGSWAPRTMDGVSYYLNVSDFFLPMPGSNELTLTITVTSDEELIIRIPALQADILFEKAF